MFSRVVSVDLEILNVKISDYWDFDIFVLISKTDIQKIHRKRKIPFWEIIFERI